MLLKPLITEKTVAETKRSKFAFLVALNTDKTSIKKQVEKIFNVNVLGVQTMTVRGKAYRTGKRWKYAYKPDAKKAIVTLKPGQSIELFDVRPTETPSEAPTEEVVTHAESGEVVAVTPRKKGKK